MAYKQMFEQEGELQKGRRSIKQIVPSFEQLYEQSKDEEIFVHLQEQVPEDTTYVPLSV
jgi:hypothetical protein